MALAAPVALAALAAPLALAALTTPKAPTAPAAAPDACAQLRVLLAEDNDVNVFLFEAMLEGLPLHITVAQDGLAALEHVRAQRFDIGFFDVQMPGMDGLTLTRELRRLEAQVQRPRMPVVALTANAFASDVQLSLQAGCDLHITKPFDKARLRQALTTLLGDQAMQRSDEAGPVNGQELGPPAGPAAGASIAAGPTLDSAAAIARLGGNVHAYQRACEHATLFVSAWWDSFEAALNGANATNAASAGQVQALLLDLRDIAQRIGAQALAELAAKVQRTLRQAAPGALRPAFSPELQAQLQQALGACSVALAQRLKE